MLLSNLRSAITEAERFLKKARELAELTRKVEGSGAEWASSGKCSAACKRASLDLSRELSKLRGQS